MFIHRARQKSDTDRNVALTEDEIFTRLFGVAEPKSTRHSRIERTISGETVSMSIGPSPSSEWSLVAASVVNNNLITCRRSRTSGEYSYDIFRSCQSIKVPSGGRGTLSIPSFVCSTCVLTLLMGTNMAIVEGDGVGQSVMDCKPVFSLIQSENHFPKLYNLINSNLFLYLFGMEFVLSKSPVLFLGLQQLRFY